MGKNIKKFNEYITEAVIPEVKYDGLVSDIRSHGLSVAMSELKTIGDKYNVDIIDYDTFYNTLQGDEDKSTAPPKGRAPFFGFFNKHNQRPTMVIDAMNHGGEVMVDMLLNFPPHPNLFIEMLEHESVHLGQYNRNKSGKYNLPNPSNKKDYFSDKNEIMAFSQSLARFSIDNNATKETLFHVISKHPVWGDIKRTVDDKTLNRYKKYIYMYFNHYNDNDIDNDIDINNDINNDNTPSISKPNTLKYGDSVIVDDKYSGTIIGFRNPYIEIKGDNGKMQYVYPEQVQKI